MISRFTFDYVNTWLFRLLQSAFIFYIFAGGNN